MDYPIVFQDAAGDTWRRARISRKLLKEIQEREVTLNKEWAEKYDKADTENDEDEVMNTSQNKLFDVRLACIIEYCADERGKPIDIDELDVSQGQHLFQGFWRNVWGLDPKGNLL